MKQTAIVTEVKGNKATVEVERSSACAGCSESHDCIACKKKITVTAENAAGAAVGDRVVIESGSERILGYAALVFVLPLLLAFAAFFIARGSGAGDSISLICCIGAFAVSLAVILPLLNKSAKLKNKITVVRKESDGGMENNI